jgi:threonyl-tRNA synthetase
VEHYEGKFPVWLAPVQAVVMNITDKQAPYVGKVEKMLKNQGIRVISDLRNEKVGFKIREHTRSRKSVLQCVAWAVRTWAQKRSTSSSTW